MYRADEQSHSVDDARPAKRADDSVAVGEPAGDRRSRNVSDGDDGDHCGRNGGRATEATDDVENDKALQACEAELPKGVDECEHAQLPVAEDELAERSSLVGEHRVAAVALKLEDG